MRVPKHIESAARARIAKSTQQIENSLQRIAEGNPLGAETNPARLQARLRRKALLTPAESVAVAAGIRAMAFARETGRDDVLPPDAAPEKVWGDTIDFVGVAFLERGSRAARSVARVAYRDGGQPLGTGFMVSPRLFLTNNHVIGSAAEAAALVAEFDYELDASDVRRDLTRFRFDPQTFFVTDERDDLDFTLIAIGARDVGPLDLSTFGWTRLSSAKDKHALGEFANIVQHPDGRYKEVVLRENRLVSRLDTVLHYVADTEPGSSGSPVFNNEWQVVALHHWGGPWRQRVDAGGRRVPTEVNEGIRTSAIVQRLLDRSGGLDTHRRALLHEVLRLEESSQPDVPSVAAPAVAPAADGRSATIDAEGRVTWRIPLELSVRLPLAEIGAPAASPALPAVPATTATTNGTFAADGDGTAERRIEVDPDYANRRGYKPSFLAGFPIPLPKLTKSLEKHAAKNDDGDENNPFELRYENFSIVINKVRRLAFFTACNIDGANLKTIDRKTGAISRRSSGDADEALSEGAEASETWFRDERIRADAECNQKLYSGQKVDGFKTGSSGWMNRMFQRGHLVRRLDPLWGSDKRVRRAEADTFHFTNCTPQVGFFNMGSASRSRPGGGRLWRALEDYVLENAAEERLRVSVFTGPVLDDHKDRPWRQHIIPGFKVPLRFWKIVAWADDGELNAVAMLADQGPVLQSMPEDLEPEDAESFADTSLVEDFLTTVQNVEALTGLDFGAVLRDADVRAGSESAGGQLVRVTSFEAVPLGRARSPRGGRAALEPHRRIERSPKKPTNGRTKPTAKR